MAADAAVRHQAEHPQLWDPSLVETTSVWTAVVRTIQHDLRAALPVLHGHAPPNDSFVRRCAADAALRAQLEALRARQLHGLLLAWTLDTLKLQLREHVAPFFWSCYRLAPHSSLFGAMRGLHAYMGTRLQLMHVLERCLWGEAEWTERAWDEEPWAEVLWGEGASRHRAAARHGSPMAISCEPSPVRPPSKSPDPMERDEPAEGEAAAEGSYASYELLTSLQAVVLAFAPEGHSFDAWVRMSLPWTRLPARGDGGGGEGGSEDEEEGEGMDEDLSQRESLRRCCVHLSELCWLPLIEPTLSSTLHAHLHAKLMRRCANQFEERMLQGMLSWLDAKVVTWLRVVLQPAAPEADPSFMLQQWQARLHFFLMQSLAELRTAELFDIIIDYPDSLPALSDLKECLQHTHQHADVVASLSKAIDQRLLKPGTDTSKIIQVYVSAIKALRHLDPSGVTLESVSEPVRTYLKARPDTIRKIVTSLTDPDDSAATLVELLEPTNDTPGGIQQDAALEEGAVDPDEVKGDEAAMFAWVADPVQADPMRSSFARRSSDVLSILVNIYGSKTLFVNEFRSMLSDKLIASSDYETDKEVRNVELLKKRFGDEALKSCEVMLRDIGESKRVTQAIHKHFGDEECKVLTATIVSRLCWPTLEDEKFELPEAMEREMARFEKQFMHHKAPRKLMWKRSLGTVTIDVAFEDRTVKGVTCSPLHASILHCFAEKSSWSLSSLAAHLKVKPDALRKKMAMWINRGFIHEISRSAEDTLYEAPACLGSGGDARHQGVEEEEQPAESAKDEALSQFEAQAESYVIGMLTNLGTLPLARIHNMLKMFLSSEERYDYSEAELRRFLSRLVEDGTLEHSDGVYKIRREG
ncbi:hypothetical protein AB1Y20_003625 [Prymnesium parvum]|uniref:Anaphase-promoting complex subunit 2 n=1 Tax=Prymnesium parvum TaxID=97485 RepID=A0AB34J591_PRYPA